MLIRRKTWNETLARIDNLEAALRRAHEHTAHLISERDRARAELDAARSLHAVFGAELDRSDRRDRASAEAIRELTRALGDRERAQDPMAALAAQLDVAPPDTDAADPADAASITAPAGPDLSIWLSPSGGEPPPGTIFPGRPPVAADEPSEETPA